MKRVSETGWRPLTRIGRLRIGLLLGWLFVYLVLLLTGGCTQTEVEEDVIPPHALKDVEAGFNLNVLANQTPATRSITFTSEGTIEADTLVAAVGDTVRTRAAAPLSEVQENKIASLWVGQYDATSGARLFSKYISSMTDNTVNVKLKQSQSGAKSRVWFVANASDLGEVATENALKERILAHKSTNEGLPEDNLCKMTGTWEGIVQEGGVKEVTVNLKRLLAKITFTYSMGEGFAFTPSSVLLKSVPDVSQVEVPTGQLTSGVTYTREYTGTASQSGATVYWYLPENMAGTVSGENAVDSEKKKTGKGVTNATYIVLSGEAVQGGVTYKNVSFTFYPGTNMNNYDIVRNSHYTMTVKLVGIDVSDERISVGEIPPIEVDPTEMPANKGGEKDIQITARPGQEWVFDMPDWLSALLDGKEITSGATITHQGPANVKFRAVEANPKAEKRSVSFNIEVNGTDQEITITQSGSTLTKGSDVSLTAVKDSEGESSFTATEGLQWSAALSGDGWLGWAATNSGTSGTEAPVGAQTLKVKTTAANPSAQARTGKITVKAGASVGDATYTGLKQEIAVSQAGSTVNGSTINSIAAKGATGDASFTATAGLPWASSVTSGSWITLNSGGSGTPTTGSAQTINYTAAINPSSSTRQGTIRVHAGDVTAGPTGDIVLNQLGAMLSVSGAKTIAATASTGNTSTFNATAGLSWNVGVTSTGSWLSLTGTTSGTNNTTGANQTITYSAVVNPDASTRQGTITVKVGNAVTGTDDGLTETIAVTQEASSLTASGSETTLAATKDDNGTITFKGTSGLSFSVTKPDWLTLTGTTSGTTNGTDQTFGYKTNAVNLNSTERAAANISVKAGNITKTVAIKQSGSTFTVDKTEIELENTATSGSVTVKGTEGLPWTVSPSVQTSGITPATTSSTATGTDQTLTFNATANTGGAREATFTVAVTGGNHSKEVKVKQKAGLTGITVTIDQSVLTSYRTKTTDMAVYPPFNYDGSNRLPNGSSFNGSTTMTGSYTIQVQKGQRSDYANYSTMQSYCSSLNEDGTGWRIPTQIELHAMYINKAKIEGSTGASAFISSSYWSSSVCSGNSGRRCRLYFNGGGFGWSSTSSSYYVRCVRDN